MMKTGLSAPLRHRGGGLQLPGRTAPAAILQLVRRWGALVLPPAQRRVWGLISAPRRAWGAGSAGAVPEERRPRGGLGTASLSCLERNMSSRAFFSSEKQGLATMKTSEEVPGFVVGLLLFFF